jgi:signal transduction histidine kinase
MTQTERPLLSTSTPIALKKLMGEAWESDELFQGVVTVFQKACDVNHCLLLLIEQEEIKKVYSTIEANLEKKKLINFSRDLYQHNKSHLKQNSFFSVLSKDPLMSPRLKNIARQLQIQSILLIPLQYQQERQDQLGLLCIYSCQKAPRWTEKNLALIRYLIAQNTLFISCYQQFVEEKHYQTLIKDINQKLNASHATQEILNEILQQVVKIFEVEQALILEIADLPHLCRLQSPKRKTEEIQQWRIYQAFPHLPTEKLPKSYLEKICLQNLCEVQKISCLPDPTKIGFNGSPLSYYSLLSLPITIKGNFFGILILQTTQYKRRFTETEIQILQQISEQIAIAIYQIQLQEQLAASQETSLEETHHHTSEYFSNMTHELRAPLAGILGFARMLQEQIYGSLNPKQIQYVNAIVTSSEHLMAIVNDLLDLSKIEANREELLLEKLAVEDICLASLSIVQGKAEQQRLALHLDIAENVDFCYADQQRLKQILINLLSNAIKFTEVGSVTLRVERKRESLTFSVIDTGIGIAPTELDKLFQPFQQVKNSLSRKHKGTGLGLALSQKLARLHGGEITLISLVGEGSCFTVEIPHRCEETI